MLKNRKCIRNAQQNKRVEKSAINCEINHWELFENCKARIEIIRNGKVYWKLVEKFEMENFIANSKMIVFEKVLSNNSRKIITENFRNYSIDNVFT